MHYLRIRGQHSLKGELPINGSKNATLPIMCASLLTDEPLILTNITCSSDVHMLCLLLEDLGVKVQIDVPQKALILQAKEITNTTASYDFVSKMRASFWVLGSLLGRCGQACVSFPGGCSIGVRPVDLYLMALRVMGADITIEKGYVSAMGPLHGGEISFPKKSVGATHNTIMAAVLTPGTTLIHNPALEPEITDLITVLRKMGADIEGEGTPTLTIRGVKKLHGTTHAIIPDRIETVSLMLAVALTKGKALLKNSHLKYSESVNHLLENCGLSLTQTETGILVDSQNFAPVGMPIITSEYPGFPTDLQPIICTMLTVAQGESLVTERIFENRFLHVPELQRMGADITVLDTNSILIRGVNELSGTEVTSSDLRNSFSLVLAGLIAKGETVVSNIQYLDRGYFELEQRLSKVGADIERLEIFESGLKVTS